MGHATVPQITPSLAKLNGAVLKSSAKLAHADPLLAGLRIVIDWCLIVIAFQNTMTQIHCLE